MVLALFCAIFFANSSGHPVGKASAATEILEKAKRRGTVVIASASFPAIRWFEFHVGAR
jgi:hypothetical protein